MLLNIIKTGGIGCVVFTIFLFVMSKSGVASAMRDEKGNFKKSTNLKAISG